MARPLNAAETTVLLGLYLLRHREQIVGGVCESTQAVEQSLCKVWLVVGF